MPRSHFNLFIILAISLALLAGCATPLPPTYSTFGSGPVLKGPVLAVAGEGRLVAAVNRDGLYVKTDDGPWVKQEVPGLRKYSQVTSLAVDKGVIYLGSDGEGLHILSDGTWEVKTSRYGGLPDDGVLCIALDGSDNGLPGETVWVGTREGIAALRDGKGTVYRPDGDWLVSLSGTAGPGAGKVYVGPGFKLGRKGEESKRFRPPISAIAAGPDGVVFGNRRSGLAVVSKNAAAVLKFADELVFTRLAVDRDVIWAGTESGVLWGGLKDSATGKPWPTHWSDLVWFGTLFGSRDTRDYEYRWRHVGYNTAAITGLEKRGFDLWVVHRSNQGVDRDVTSKVSADSDSAATSPITDIRRYVEIGEYINRKQAAKYESYGIGTGIKGRLGPMYVTPDGNTIWVGTTKGLWGLGQY